jgi:hypothetical protein
VHRRLITYIGTHANRVAARLTKLIRDPLDAISIHVEQA